MAAEAPLVELVERGTELERLGAALRDAANGQGALVAVEGTPGLGKSALLDALATRATTRGFAVHRARGVEFERALAYGVARQLFRRPIEPELLEAVPTPARQIVHGSASPAEPEPDDPFAVLHGLSSLCAALAETTPVLLLLDDAQWADDASLRFVAFLRERLDGLRALIALGLRSPGHGERADLAAQLAGDPRTIRIEPAPLSVAAARELLGRHVDDPPDSLCRASHEATGGTPF
jgi:predicted ATPase